ncbi:MAG: glycosyltransferase family 2 protein [Phycisphaerales bacterium]
MPLVAPTNSPQASVIIPTKDRRDDLRKALASLGNQTANVEAIIIDDGSSDGTLEMVRGEFPLATIHRNERSRGSCPSRNHAASLATSPIIVSIDDDCILASPRTIEQTLAEFDLPRIGAVGIPYKNVRTSQDVLQVAPADGRVWVIPSFRGCAAAWRRSLHEQIGGQSEILGHGVEEPEFCLRMWGAGFAVRAGRADPVDHYESPRRDSPALLYLYGRNHILLAWINCPFPFVLLQIPGTAVKCVLTGLRAGRIGRSFWGVVNGLIDVVRGKARRKPVPLALWRAFRRLHRNHMEPLESVEPRAWPGGGRG